jgi:hypothetical protein
MVYTVPTARLVIVVPNTLHDPGLCKFMYAVLVPVAAPNHGFENGMVKVAVPKESYSIQAVLTGSSNDRFGILPQIDTGEGEGLGLALGDSEGLGDTEGLGEIDEDSTLGEGESLCDGDSLADDEGEIEEDSMLNDWEILDEKIEELASGEDEGSAELDGE